MPLAFVNKQVTVTICLAAIYLLSWPSRAEACSCGGGTPPSSVAFRNADAVFIGTADVVTIPAARSRIASGGARAGLGAGPMTTVFAVTRVFRGSDQGRVIVRGDGTCDYAFARSEAYLVYAQERGGVLTAQSICTRTRPLSEAVEDVKYLDGLEQGRPQAILYGVVHRRITGRDGRAALQALFETLEVVAVGVGSRMTVPTDRWGPYQIVLPPGEFQVWVERAGQRVTSSQTIRVVNGEDRSLSLTVSDDK